MMGLIFPLYFHPIAQTSRNLKKKKIVFVILEAFYRTNSEVFKTIFISYLTVLDVQY